MIPQALSSSIMNSGGLGMAESFAQELDPALLSQASGATSTATGTSPSASSTTTSGTDGQSSGTDVGSARQVAI